MTDERHFQCHHFVDSALVALRAAEASLQERLNQLPCQCRPNHLPAKREYIHFVVFHALMSGEHIVDEPGAHTGNLVGADVVGRLFPSAFVVLQCFLPIAAWQWQPGCSHFVVVVIRSGLTCGLDAFAQTLRHVDKGGRTYRQHRPGTFS